MYLLIDFGYKELTLKVGTPKFEKVLKASKEAVKKFKEKSKTSELYSSLNRASVERGMIFPPKQSKQNKYMQKAISASGLTNKLLGDKVDYNTQKIKDMFNKK